MNSVFFVEKLTLTNWFFQLLPQVVSQHPHTIFVFDASPFAFGLASKMTRLFGIHLEKMDFRLVDVKDDKGLLICLRIACHDLLQIQEEIKNDASFQNLLKQCSLGDRFPFFLAKGISTISLNSRYTLWRALLITEIVKWKSKQFQQEAKCFLFLQKRPWMKAIKAYGAKLGIRVYGLQVLFCWNPRKSFLSPLYRLARVGLWYLKYSPFLKRKTGRQEKQRLAPKIVLECHYHLNLNRPEIFSELFFWQESDLPGKDILVTFHISKEPLTLQKFSELKQHGMSSIALDPGATQVAVCPPFSPSFKGALDVKRGRFSKKMAKDRSEQQWFKGEISDYQRRKNYWTEFFDKTNGKIFISWFRYDGLHCVIADALKSHGGVMAIYQRALDTNPSPEIAICPDIFFGYSKFVAGIERSSGSVIPYFVITGYLGDHRAPLLRAHALKIREKLQKRGARRILAFTDENSHGDSIWHTGHEYMRANYEFLLEKLLSDFSIGLVLKPKVPHTLRSRLGPVSVLLKKAEETGRCHIYEEGTAHGHYPPSIAALSADVAIHGHLCAATAGLDSALTGVPTLLVDREGWSISPLYNLGIGKVIFNNWEHLWEACLEHWRRPQGVAGFGDWSPMLDQLDPFRDGKAAHRMGTYIQWLMEGFKQNLSRETVMADAAERYCKLWGIDNIVSVNCNSIVK